MAEVTEHHIEIVRTARYYCVGEYDREGELWYVLHGYRQTASRFISRFESLANGSRTVHIARAYLFKLGAAHMLLLLGRAKSFFQGTFAPTVDS